MAWQHMSYGILLSAGLFLGHGDVGCRTMVASCVESTVIALSAMLYLRRHVLATAWAKANRAHDSKSPCGRGSGPPEVLPSAVAPPFRLEACRIATRDLRARALPRARGPCYHGTTPCFGTVFLQPLSQPWNLEGRRAHLRMP